MAKKISVGSTIWDLLLLICVTLRNYFSENSRDMCKQLTSEKVLYTVLYSRVVCVKTRTSEERASEGF